MSGTLAIVDSIFSVSSASLILTYSFSIAGADDTPHADMLLLRYIPACLGQCYKNPVNKACEGIWVSLKFVMDNNRCQGSAVFWLHQR